MEERQRIELVGSSVDNFMKGFTSKATKESYSKKLRYFLEFVGMKPDEFLAKVKEDKRFAEHSLIDYVEARKGDGVSGSTIRQVRDALKHFLEMNDLDEGINWKKIVKTMPRARKVGSDRAPTIEEIRHMVDNADIRMKCIILLAVSSGIRLGAIPALRWRDLEPLEKDGKIAAAKLTVYRGEPEEYVTFITPECYEAILEYRRRREAIGESVGPDSPLIRDAWDNNRYRQNRKEDPRVPRPLTAKAIANEMGLFLKKIGLRGERQERYEFKQVHGFRKFFKTNAERAMKTLDVEKLMGHAENYYKPSLDYLMAEYLKAVPHLTVSEARHLKDEMEKKIVLSDAKIGELERAGMALQERLRQIENRYRELKELLGERNSS
jgi:integrase